MRFFNSINYLFLIIGLVAVANTVAAMSVHQGDPEPPNEFVSEVEAQAEVDTELQNIKQMVRELDPKVQLLEQDGHELELALRLRDIVYKKVPVRNDWTGIDWNNLDNFVYLALTAEDKGFICGGLAATYSMVLTAFNIVHRNVAIFEHINPTGQSHASVEIFANGRWVISDPTFNISVSDLKGNLLSWEQTAKLCSRDGNPVIVYGPNTPASDRSNIDTYYIQLCQLTKFVAMSSAPGLTFSTFPKQWDGEIVSKDGMRFSLRSQLETSMPWKIANYYRKTSVIERVHPSQGPG